MVSYQQKESFELIKNIIQKQDAKSLYEILGHDDLVFVDNLGWTVVHEAARSSNKEMMHMLLQDRRCLDLLDHHTYDGFTPLLTAVSCSNTAATQVLLDYQADIFYKHPQSDDTVLHYAAQLPDSTIINLLLAFNLPQEYINSINKYGETALDVALKTSSSSIQLLLQAGVDHLEQNPVTGRTLLHTALAYNQCGIVQELLSSNETLPLVDKVDKRGDTPFMLAIRLGCVKCVKSLGQYMSVDKGVNKQTGDSVLHIAVHTESDDILKNVVMFSNKTLINKTNINGMTPLLLAIEESKMNCFNRLIKMKLINVVNKKNKETVLHAAIRKENNKAITCLLQSQDPAVFWCFTQKNKDGKTPFWMAIEIGHAKFIMEARKGRWIDIEELNDEGDTATFVAAACGHLNTLKMLLLSEKYFTFTRIHGTETSSEDYQLIRNAKVCCDIYNSDIFILSGEVKEEANKQVSWAPQNFFDHNKLNGRNIFHACAISGSVNCLEFIHTLCKLFYFNSTLFDAPDKKGNTPLFLATTNYYGGPECVYFFLTNGAGILNQNEAGDIVLESLLTNTENAVQIMIQILNHGIIYDIEARGLIEDNSCLQLDFSLLLHKNEPVTKVVKRFYELTRDPHQHALLQHTLIKTYVHLVLTSAQYFFILRFFLSCFHTLLLTIFILIITASTEIKYSEYEITQGVCVFIAVLSMVGILFSIPLLFVEKANCLTVVICTLLLTPYFVTIALMMTPVGSDIFFDIAAVDVLVSWISLMMYSTTIFKSFSHQIAMLSQVIWGMFLYARIVIAILIPFSICFHCIFNDFFYFVSPIKSFIYTALILLVGDFSDSFEYFESKHFSYGHNSNKSEAFVESHNTLIKVLSQFDLLFESLFLLIFIITCVLGLVNMLIGLAVRDSKTLMTEGEVFQRRLQIYWLNSLELFLSSSLYKIFHHTPFIYLFGIIPSKNAFDLDIKYVPLNERKTTPFSKSTLVEIKRNGSHPKDSLEKEDNEETS